MRVLCVCAPRVTTRRPSPYEGIDSHYKGLSKTKPKPRDLLPVSVIYPKQLARIVASASRQEVRAAPCASWDILAVVAVACVHRVVTLTAHLTGHVRHHRHQVSCVHPSHVVCEDGRQLLMVCCVLRTLPQCRAVERIVVDLNVRACAGNTCGSTTRVARPLCGQDIVCVAARLLPLTSRTCCRLPGYCSVPTCCVASGAPAAAVLSTGDAGGVATREAAIRRHAASESAVCGAGPRGEHAVSSKANIRQRQHGCQGGHGRQGRQGTSSS